MENLRRGQLYYIKKQLNFNTEPSGQEDIGKPVLIISADKKIMEKNGTITVANITRRPRSEMDTHLEVQLGSCKAVAILEQEVTISIDRLGEYIGELTEDEMNKVNNIVCKIKGIDLEGIISRYINELNEKEKEIAELKQLLQKKENKSFFGILKK